MSVLRSRVGGSSKLDVSTCRSLWADMDEVTPEVARWRCHEIGIREPTIAVDSGFGVHLYWLLNDPVSVIDASNRVRFEGQLKSLQRQLGCDATSDVNRLLRLPGFWNVKDARNATAPSRCDLVQCLPGCRVAVEQFPQLGRNAADDNIQSTPAAPKPVDRYEQILHRLDVPATDRSRRDFGVICELLRAGLAPAEIWRQVAGRSKFATNGYAYFLTTIGNARDAVEDR